MRYTEKMRGTLGARELAALRPGAYVINIARGGDLNAWETRSKRGTRDRHDSSAVMKLRAVLVRSMVGPQFTCSVTMLEVLGAQ